MGASAGRSGRRWTRLKEEQRAKRLPCWLCGQPIDYALDKSDEDSFSVDHELPLSTHPHLAEEPSNLRSAHLRCNKRRGNRKPQPTIGAPSENW